MATTSGAGLIYNVARIDMLSGVFRWTDPDKMVVLVSTDYVPNETHKTYLDLIKLGIVDLGYTGDMTGLYNSVNGWAGSNPSNFSAYLGGVLVKPIGAAIIMRHIGTAIPELDFTKMELIACLTTFLGGPLYLDGTPFSLTFDQSNGQQGWFRP